MLPHFPTRRAYAGLAIALLAGALSACSGSAAAKPPKGASGLSFDATVDVVAAVGEAPVDADARVREIVTLFEDWYRRAFVDPRAWKDPGFPALLSLFTGDAREQARRELHALTIGEARDEVAWVEPKDATIRVTLYTDAAGEPAFAIADARFIGHAALHRGGPALRIVQKGVYHLRIEDGTWKVFAYQARADQVQDPPGKRP